MKLSLCYSIYASEIYTGAKEIIPVNGWVDNNVHFPLSIYCCIHPQLPLACSTVQSAVEWKNYDSWIGQRKVWSMWKHEKYKVNSKGGQSMRLLSVALV